MKKLYAPWRSNYVNRVHTNTKSVACVFCTIRDAHNDAPEFVLKRFEHCMVMLNKYPYNAGHILVVPYGHKQELHEYTAVELAECMMEVSIATHVLKKVLGAHGCNVGINIGKAAGAGIPEHLHVHVLPRFTGDTNFLPTLAETKQISLDLSDIYKKLLTEYAKL